MRINLINCLNSIDPALVDYNMWLAVGMALHAEGYSCQDWDAWSARDVMRYHQGECERKWEGFDAGRIDGVHGGTIVELARQHGWEPPEENEVIWGFDMTEIPAEYANADDIFRSYVKDVKPLDSVFIEQGILQQSDNWDPVQQVRDYITCVFRPGDLIGYVTKSYKDSDGKYKPSGCIFKTYEQILSELDRYSVSMPNNTIACVFGDHEHEAGAWICFNPFSEIGAGRKNSNVAEFRYALVESDELDINEQANALLAMNLPIVALVSSGKKSVHAIVRIDAYDLAEYRKRVNALYEYCTKRGFKVDVQNKNPARLSRLPGVERGDSRQELLYTNVNAMSWDTWSDSIMDEVEDMPNLDNLSVYINNLPQMAPTLIDDILRCGHKMLLVGPSKAGKSFLLIELCIAIAEGRTWLGKQCRQGSVLYINLELDRASCLHRFRDMYTALNLRGDFAHNIEIWNLRGKSMPLDKLVPRIIRRIRVMQKPPIAVIIDPIYKVITGDENSASEMGKFCNNFDVIAKETGASVIYCHHQSKGAQGFKAAMDRASGSGVFARDPDALVDMSELVMPKKLKRENAGRSAWRASFVLREFATPEPVNMWFAWPRHILDGAKGQYELTFLGIAGDEVSKRTEGNNTNATKAEERAAQINEAIDFAVQCCQSLGKKPTRKNIMVHLDDGSLVEKLTPNMIRKWTDPRKWDFAQWTVKQDEDREWVLVPYEGEYEGVEDE